MFRFKSAPAGVPESSHYNERDYAYSVNPVHMMEIAHPIIEKFMLILQESGISANDAFFIPGLLDRAIKESNRLAQAGTNFRAYREEHFDPRGYCEMFTEDGVPNQPFDSYGNPTKIAP